MSKEIKTTISTTPAVIPELQIGSKYSREDVHKAFNVKTKFTKGSGYWGISGIIKPEKALKNFIFFVTGGSEQSEYMFDESINHQGIMKWQSQPAQDFSSPIIDDLINHDKNANFILLFLRNSKRDDYTYMGKLDYSSHIKDLECPVHFRWKIMEWNEAKQFVPSKFYRNNEVEKIPEPTLTPTPAPTSAPIQAHDKDISARIIGREVIEERQLKITKKILALAEEGKSVKEIVSGLGYTRSMVLECLRDIFFPDGFEDSVTVTNIKVDHILRDNRIEFYRNKLQDLVNEGRNINQIAKEVNSNRAFVEEALKKIFSLDDSGASPNDIKRQIANILKDKQRIIRDERKRISAKNKHVDFMKKHREMIEMRNTGKTLDEIGKVKGVTRERVRQIIKRIEMHGPYEGLEIIDIKDVYAKQRDRNAQKRKVFFNKLTHEFEEDLIKLYSAGANNKEIKDQLNFSSANQVSECLEVLKQEGKISPIRYSNKTGNSEEELKIIYDTIQTMRDKGESLEAIGNALGYSSIWVSQKIRQMRDKGIYVADNHNMSGREYLRDWDKINSRSKAILKLLKEGKRPAEIERILELHTGSVSRHIRTYLEDEIKEIYLNRKK